MNAALEHELLGQLILKPALLESSETLKASLFNAGDERTAFAGITAQWEEVRPEAIDCALLARKTGLSETWLMGLVDGNFRPDPATFRARVAELQRYRLGEELTALSAEAGGALVKGVDVDADRLYRELERARAILSGGQNEAGILPGTLKTGAELQALDINVEWTIDKLQPARSLTLLHSRGGLGKTWLELGASKAVSTGAPFLGLATKKRPVYYIDFENPLPLLVERVRKLDIRDVNFWTLCATTPPPKLDSADWALYAKVLPPGSMVIFDTLRAAHDGDENSSQDAAVVMGRLKQLRETGLDIIALHHTGKADDRIFKGSTAWADLADNVLDFHQHRRHDLKEADDEDLAPQDALFSLGTGSKTRFAPFRTFLSFDPETGAFSLADDPKLTLLDQLAEYIAGEGLGKNQKTIIAWIHDELGIGKRASAVDLLNRGEGTRWKSIRSCQNARIYEPL